MEAPMSLPCEITELLEINFLYASELNFAVPPASIVQEYVLEGYGIVWFTTVQLGLCTVCFFLLIFYFPLDQSKDPYLAPGLAILQSKLKRRQVPGIPIVLRPLVSR